MKVIDLYEAANLSPWSFDQSNQGWRAISNPQKQIVMITQYLRRYARSLDQWQPDTPQEEGSNQIQPYLLIFHLAQVYAIKGDTTNAVSTFSKVSRTSDQQWNNYVQSTIAFLKGDEAAFKQYATPENYNNSTLDRLRRHWGQPYKIAYNAE